MEIFLIWWPDFAGLLATLFLLASELVLVTVALCCVWGLEWALVVGSTPFELLSGASMLWFGGLIWSWVSRVRTESPRQLDDSPTESFGTGFLISWATHRQGRITGGLTAGIFALVQRGAVIERCALRGK